VATPCWPAPVSAMMRVLPHLLAAFWMVQNFCRPSFSTVPHHKLHIRMLSLLLPLVLSLPELTNLGSTRARPHRLLSHHLAIHMKDGSATSTWTWQIIGLNTIFAATSHFYQSIHATYSRKHPLADGLAASLLSVLVPKKTRSAGSPGASVSQIEPACEYSFCPYVYI